MVDVVQLVEHRIVVPSVVGSSPIIHPFSAFGFPEAFFVVGKSGIFSIFVKIGELRDRISRMTRK